MVSVYMDDERGRVVQYDRHDERQTAIMLLGPTHELELDLPPVEISQRHNRDIYPQCGYVGYTKQGGD